MEIVSDLIGKLVHKRCLQCNGFLWENRIGNSWCNCGYNNQDRPELDGDIGECDVCKEYRPKKAVWHKSLFVCPKCISRVDDMSDKYLFKYIFKMYDFADYDRCNFDK